MKFVQLKKENNGFTTFTNSIKNVYQYYKTTVMKLLQCLIPVMLCGGALHYMCNVLSFDVCFTMFVLSHVLLFPKIKMVSYKEIYIITVDVNVANL